MLALNVFKMHGLLYSILSYVAGSNVDGTALFLCGGVEILSEQVSAASTSVGMIRIPASPFLMGSIERKDEEPVGEVWTAAFYIDRFPVTNAQFYAFWRAGICEEPTRQPMESVKPVIKSDHDYITAARQL